MFLKIYKEVGMVGKLWEEVGGKICAEELLVPVFTQP